MGVPLLIRDTRGQLESGPPIDPWRVEELQPALALQQAVDHAQTDPDASDQALRGFVVRSQRRPNPAYFPGPGDGGDSVHEGGTDAEALVASTTSTARSATPAASRTRRAMPTGCPCSEASHATWR